MQSVAQRRNTDTKQISLLQAHRWIGELAESLWRCVPPAAPCRDPGADPICHGCRIEVTYDEIPKLDRFRGAWMATEIGQEALALQLDVTAAAKEATLREEFFRERLQLVRG